MPKPARTPIVGLVQYLVTCRAAGGRAMSVARGSSEERLAIDSLRLHGASLGPAKNREPVIARRSVPGREGRQPEPAILSDEY
jgi:hypothetical protein